MKHLIFAATTMALVSAGAHALTLKSGQVLGSDGGVYDGASPAQMEVYKQRAANGGDVAGIAGNNVFVVVGDDITFVPVSELQGKTKDSKMNIIGDAVVEQVTGSDAISFEQLNELQDIADESGVAIEDILATNDALSQLDADLAAVITDEIDALIEEGALEDVQQLLSSEVIRENLETIAAVTQQVEEQLGELATDIDYYNACVAQSGQATCDALAAELGDEVPGS